MKKKKIKYSLAILVSLVLVFIYAKSVYSTNKNVSSPKENIHGMQEELLVPRSQDLFFQVTKASLLNSSEVEEILPDFYESSKDAGLEYAMVLLTLNVQNNSNEPQSIENLKYAVLTMNNNYTNGLALEPAIELNENNFPDEVPPNQSEEIIFAYGLTKINLKKKIYENLREQEFYLTFQLSPEIERVQLSFVSK